MLRHIEALLSRVMSGALARHLSVAFLGHLFSKGIGVVTFLVMTGTLGPIEYGLYSLALAVFQIAEYLSELGLDTSAQRFAAKSFATDASSHSADRMLKSVFLLKLVSGTVVLVLGWVSAPLVAGVILKRPDMVGFLRVSYFGVYGVQLSGFYSAYFGARLEFGKNAVFSLAAPTAILIAITGAWISDALTAYSALVIYSIVPTTVCALAVLVLPHGFLRNHDWGLATIRSVWRFGRWIYLGDLLGTVRFRVNSILLARLATMADVGLYSYADKLASVLTLFTSTILTVVVPHASRLVTQDDLKGLLKSSYRALLWVLPGVIAIPFLARPLIGFLAPEYIEATPLFTILFVSVLFSLVALPSRAVTYSINQPQVGAYIEMIALALTLIVSVILVSSRGAVGAAIAMLIQRAVSAWLLMAWTYLHVFRKSREEVERGSMAGLDDVATSVSRPT